MGTAATCQGQCGNQTRNRPKSDIIVFDHGLHWKLNERQAFQNDMTNYSTAYKQGDQNNEKINLTLLVWRETSAQHFNSSGGYFGRSVRYGVSYKGPCIPITTKGKRRLSHVHHEGDIQTSGVHVEKYLGSRLYAATYCRQEQKENRICIKVCWRTDTLLLFGIYFLPSAKRLTHGFPHGLVNAFSLFCG